MTLFYIKVAVNGYMLQELQEQGDGSFKKLGEPRVFTDINELSAWFGTNVEAPVEA